MLRYNPLFRGSSRSVGLLRPVSWRGHAQRRLESTEAPKEPVNRFVEERKAVKLHAAQTSDLWRKLMLYAVPPCIIIACVNAWNLWNEHWEHWSHMPPLEERPQYPYMNIRSKAYFWGDGDKTLFWNDKVNYHKRD